MAKVLYWISTGILAIMMLRSGISYFTQEEMKKAFEHLGFPPYFRIELGIAKIAGVIALILPFTPRLIKGFAYSGFAIAFVSAIVAHASMGDPVTVILKALGMLALLTVSFVCFQKTWA